ncbi:MAG TPA: hypothetical protein VFW87_13245 [Pirellulales bacterium]|nr:hypothetical protein [Pirellulales bacterium]
MLDASGNVIHDLSGRNSSGGAWKDEASGRKDELTTYQFDFAPPAPVDPRMRVTVLEGAHEVQVPFELVDLKVAPRGRRAENRK